MSVRISRRQLLKSVAVGTAGASASGWFPALADQLTDDPKRTRHCVLLWMSGGPTQTDTWDLKPEHENGGEFKEIDTNAPGLRFSEHLPKLATMGDKLAVLRGLSTREGDHGRGTYLMRTGHVPMESIQYPSIGASLANQLGASAQRIGLPANVSIGAFRAFNQEAFGPGFLGTRCGPLMVGATDIPGAIQNAGGFPQLKVKDLELTAGITEGRMGKRLALWKRLQSEFIATHGAGAPKTHNLVYQGAVNLMNSEDAGAFNLAEEKDEIREEYGNSVFGQGCLLARRLIERGVPFVEVSLGTSSGGAGWDTHSDNFNQVRQLSGSLDAGWATLMKELDERGLLESTTILWMGEFGRTPQINGSTGRDHFPNAWSCVLGGGGIAGGQAYGKTSEDGMEVIENEVGSEDVLATLCSALGVRPGTMQMSNTGRPIPVADASPIEALLA